MRTMPLLFCDKHGEVEMRKYAFNLGKPHVGKPLKLAFDSRAAVELQPFEGDRPLLLRHMFADDLLAGCGIVFDFSDGRAEHLLGVDENPAGRKTVENFFVERNFFGVANVVDCERGNDRVENSVGTSRRKVGQNKIHIFRPAKTFSRHAEHFFGNVNKPQTRRGKFIANFFGEYPRSRADVGHERAVGNVEHGDRRAVELVELGNQFRALRIVF